jgi:hypothetical protein
LASQLINRRKQYNPDDDDDKKVDVDEADDVRDERLAKYFADDDLDKFDDDDEIDKVIGGYGKRQLFNNAPGGLFNYQIADMMKKYRKLGFKGVFAVDQIHMIPLKRTNKMLSFIMNTEPIRTPNGHWVAVILTPTNLEYFDSFGEDPSPTFLKNMMKLAESWSPKSLLQFKINRVKFQRNNSVNCGFFAMKFLIDRYSGKNFKQATGFDIINNAIKGEKEIERFKNKIKEFGAI